MALVRGWPKRGDGDKTITDGQLRMTVADRKKKVKEKRQKKRKRPKDTLSIPNMGGLS